MNRTPIVLGAALLALGATAPARAQSPLAARDPVATALAEYERTGDAPVIREGDVVLYPFGHGTPKLSCARLRACRIELQSGETVLSPPALGDTDRWLTVQIATGPNGATPVVVVKPADCGLETNIMISTDRRIYDLDLDAAACGRESKRQPSHTRTVRFYFPDDRAALASAPEAPALPTTAEMVARARNTNYRWKRKNGFPWEPARIADDGVRTYIQLPPEARHGVAPVLYLVDDEGEYTVLNYTPRDDIYVTDRVLNRAALVIREGSGDRERTLHIERYAPGRRFSLGSVVPVLGGVALFGVLTAFLVGG